MADLHPLQPGDAVEFKVTTPGLWYAGTLISPTVVRDPRGILQDAVLIRAPTAVLPDCADPDNPTAQGHGGRWEQKYRVRPGGPIDAGTHLTTDPSTGYLRPAEWGELRIATAGEEIDMTLVVIRDGKAFNA